MQLRINSLALTLMTGLAFACTDPEPTAPDTPPTTTPRDVDPIDGGGTAGGQIDGVVTVFVQDAESNPIAGATVVAESIAQSATGKTDDAGRIDLLGDALTGPITIHVFAGGFAYQSIYNLEASVLTLALSDGTPEVAPVATTAVATGTVSGWERLAANEVDRARIATVLPVGADLMSVTQAPRPGTVTPSNQNGSPSNLIVNGDAPFASWVDYSLEFDTRAQTLVAFGGTFTRGADPAIELTHIGVRTGMKAAANDALTDQSIELTHALDQLVSAVVPSAPSGFEPTVSFGLELDANMGIVPLASMTPEMGAASTNGPLLSDALAAARFEVELRFEATDRYVRALMRGTDSTFTFTDVITPLGTPTAAGRTVAATPASGATLHVFELTNAEGRTLWKATVIGDDQRSLTLPSAPEGMTDPLSGVLTLSVKAFDMGDFDPNDSKAAEMQLRSESAAKASVSL